MFILMGLMLFIQRASSTGDNVGLFGYAGEASSKMFTIMNLAVEGNIVGNFCYVVNTALTSL